MAFWSSSGISMSIWAASSPGTSSSSKSWRIFSDHGAKVHNTNMTHSTACKYTTAATNPGSRVAWIKPILRKVLDPEDFSSQQHKLVFFLKILNMILAKFSCQLQNHVPPVIWSPIFHSGLRLRKIEHVLMPARNIENILIVKIFDFQIVAMHLYIFWIRINCIQVSIIFTHCQNLRKQNRYHEVRWFYVV